MREDSNWFTTKIDSTQKTTTERDEKEARATTSQKDRESTIRAQSVETRVCEESK